MIRPLPLVGMVACLTVAFAPGAAAAATAGVTLSPLFQDHAVLQRGRPIPLWGKAAPGARLTVEMDGQQARATANEEGRWQAELPAHGAGGPYVLTVRDAEGGVARASDILVGDVWLCSGQSNMELQVRNAQDSYNQTQASADDGLRLLNIKKRTALAPRADLGDPAAWQAASPSTVPDFSAACFYMAQELRKSAKVPIGAIEAAWGGTQIRSWMDFGAQRKVGQDAGVDLLATYRTDATKAYAAWGGQWENWYGRKAADHPWDDPDTLRWAPVPRIALWEDWGVPALSGYDGMLWLRAEVTLTADQAKRGATLMLGGIDDVDESWVNGTPVGNGSGADHPRAYALPAGLLKAGSNEIVVNVVDLWGSGGFTGGGTTPSLQLDDGRSVPFQDWRYAKGHADTGDLPRAPWDETAGLSLIYNGMIAPLGSLSLKGVAWYQGESDVGLPGSYTDRLDAMMAGWREQFRQPALPFLIVQIAPFGAPAIGPVESATAELREQQRRAAARDPHAALVSTIDLGDRLDIHPGEKHEVGRRLARAARALAYDSHEAPSGPAVAEAQRAGADVIVSFTGVKGALQAWSSATPIGFELCGAVAESCRYARAVIEGDGVRLLGDGKPVTRIRYAWADAPVVNLYDKTPLPVGPFELAVADR